MQAGWKKKSPLKGSGSRSDADPNEQGCWVDFTEILDASIRKRGLTAHEVMDLSAEESSELRGTMLAKDKQVRNALRKIITILAADPNLQDDLMQEGLIRLWKAEAERPGRMRSWYLQNCRFRVQHWLSLGRTEEHSNDFITRSADQIRNNLRDVSDSTNRMLQKLERI